GRCAQRRTAAGRSSADRRAESDCDAACRVVCDRSEAATDADRRRQPARVSRGRTRQRGESAMNPPRTVLLLAAIDVELDATRKRLRLKSDGDTWRGRSGDRNIVAAITGIGGERARSNLHQLVA